MYSWTRKISTVHQRAIDNGQNNQQQIQQRNSVIHSHQTNDKQT